MSLIKKGWIAMSNNESGRNDSLKEIHTTFDSDGSVKNQNKKGSWLPKIMSVVAAIVLWLYVFQAVEYEKTFSGIPIEIVDNFDGSSGLGVVSNSTITVDVTLSGTKSNIDGIDASDIRAFVDLSDVNSADIYTRSVEVEVNGNVDVVSKSVEQMKLEVDKTVEKSIDKINIRKIYNRQEPYELGEILLTDDAGNPITEFILTGPETDLLAVESAVVELDLGNVKNSVESKVKTEYALTLYDSSDNRIDTKYISVKPEIISVNIPVYMTKRVKVVPEIVIDESRFEYKAMTDWVYAYGLVSVVDNLDSAKTVEVKIDEATGYIIALEAHEGVTFYKNGSDKSDNNIVTNVVINVTELPEEVPVVEVLPESKENPDDKTDDNKHNS